MSDEGTAAAEVVTESQNQAPASDAQQTTGDAPAQDLLGSAPEPNKAEAEPASDVPETYEAFKDAKGNSYDVAGLTEFTAAAKDIGLSQEKAQKIFASLHPTAERWLQQEHEKRSAGWAEAAKADKEYGGEAFQRNLGIAATAYRQFATPELKQLMNGSGLGNHPEMVRLFYRIGKAISQDSGVAGSGAPAAPKRLFPNSNMNI